MGVSDFSKTIEILYFGDDFNQPINFSPFNLLKFGKSFNQILTNILLNRS